MTEQDGRKMNSVNLGASFQKLTGQIFTEDGNGPAAQQFRANEQDLINNINRLCGNRLKNEQPGYVKPNTSTQGSTPTA